MGGGWIVVCSNYQSNFELLTYLLLMRGKLTLHLAYNSVMFGDCLTFPEGPRKLRLPLYREEVSL